jgi:hypothetical protein
LDAATIATNATGEATIIDDDASSEDGKKRSSTPHSDANTRRNVLVKKPTYNTPTTQWLGPVTPDSSLD